jgi:hypothetical protein
MATNRLQYLRKMRLEDKSYSIEELSKISGVPVAGLRSVYRRGLGAHASNLESVRLKGSYAKNPDTRKFPAALRLSAPQWGMARVYSFLNRGQTYKTADADIARKYGY